MLGALFIYPLKIIGEASKISLLGLLEKTERVRYIWRC